MYAMVQCWESRTSPTRYKDNYAVALNRCKAVVFEVGTNDFKPRGAEETIENFRRIIANIPPGRL